MTALDQGSACHAGGAPARRTLIAGHTNATAIMIAERAADFIRSSDATVRSAISQSLAPNG
jgi:hypothetical protein